MLKRMINKLRFPGLSMVSDVVYDIHGKMTYGARCSLGTRAIVVVPHGAQLNLGDDVYVGRYVELGAGMRIDIGDSTSIQDRCILVGDVVIGRYCLFSLNVLITSGAHYPHIRPELLIKDQDEYVRTDVSLSAQHSKPVRIEDDCWLGVNTVVLPGLTIGKGSVVGANSVVSMDVPPYSVVAGAPARIVKSRLQFAPPPTLDALVDADLPYFYSGFGVSATERALGKQTGGLLAKASFSLALDTSGSHGISITARSVDAPCMLKFEETVMPLRPSFGTFTYPLKLWKSGPLPFTVVGKTAAKWPVCISKVSVL